MPTAPAPLEPAAVMVLTWPSFPMVSQTSGANIAGLDFFGLPALEDSRSHPLVSMAAVLREKIPGNNEVIPVVGDMVFL